MLLAVLTVIFIYTAVIYFIPVSGEKIDETLGVSWNSSLVNSIDSLIGSAQDTQNSLENKLDNPAPNTSKKLEQRLNSIN